jgi:hypothetical protein
VIIINNKKIKIIVKIPHREELIVPLIIIHKGYHARRKG